MIGRAVPRVAAVLLALAGTMPASAQEWPIKAFEVASVEPWRDWEVLDGAWGTLGISELVPWLRGLGLDPDAASFSTVELDPRTKHAIEEHLRRSAELLERWGFPPPALEPVVETDAGNQAFRVYLLEDIEEAAGEYHNALCQDIPESIIILDAGEILDASGVVTQQGLATAGHELFHAVQFATRLFRGRCDIGDWIVEGQAEAIGWDLVRRLYGVVDPDDVNGRELWGLRPYSSRLPVARRVYAKVGTVAGDPAYRTASFWRYLAELDAARSSGATSPPPGPRPRELDYGYLSYLLGRPMAGRGCKLPGGGSNPECDAELEWLNAGLVDYPRFQVGLRRVYPAFVAAFAAYGEHRVASLGYGLRDKASPPSPSDARLAWQGNALGPCVLMEPTPERRRVAERFELLDVAARCFTVQPRGFGAEVDVDIQIAALDKDRLSQLVVGEAGGQRLATAAVSGVHPETGVARTRWTFRLPGEEGTVMVIANVAKAPADTWPQSVSVIVTLGGREHTAQEPPAGDSGQRETSESVEPGPAGTDEAARQRVDRAMSRVTALGRRTTDLRRSERLGKLILSLELVPDVLNLVDPESHQGRGGVVAQAMGSAAALQALMGRIGELRRDAEEAEAREGASIELRMPLVDYGFSGTFDDAEIRYSRPDDDALQALGPDREPNGRVTIEVYEPEILTGRFSADLVEPDHPPRLGPPPVVRSVSGRFWVSSPWEEDERMAIELTPVAADDMRDDILGIVPASMAERVRRAMEDAPGPEREGEDPDRAGPGGGAQAARAPACECTCGLKRRFEALMEEIRQAPRAFAGQERALVQCHSSCAMQLLGCDR